MKKQILSITLSAMLALGMSGAAAGAETDVAVVPSDAETANIYLVPGSYTDTKTNQTVYNTVSEGAVKLTDAQCDEIHTANAYLLTGDTLPVPATSRTDCTFNGWWSVQDAEIRYYETVPEVTETTYLYADFRAELSQPKDPVNPPEDAEEEMIHYLRIEHQDTGEIERIPLFVSGTDVPSAVTAGYGGPVQFYNEWFELRANDLIQVWVSRVYGPNPTNAPQKRGVPEPKCGFDLESSGANRTDDYIKAYNSSGFNSFLDVENPTFKYVQDESHHFRVYIKFYDDGGHLTIYMEMKD